jgi:hypothetical protein
MTAWRVDHLWTGETLMGGGQTGAAGICRRSVCYRCPGQ